MGAFGGCGVLARGDGVDGAGAGGEVGVADGGEVADGGKVADGGEVADGEGEFVPAELAFVAVMEETGDEGGRGDDLEDSGGEVGGVGGRTDLVADDIDGGAFFHQPDHGLDEVVTEFGIYPGGADDEGAVGMLPEGLVFAFELGGAVGVDGTGGVSFLQRGGGLAVEYVVGGDMD